MQFKCEIIPEVITNKRKTEKTKIGNFIQIDHQPDAKKFSVYYPDVHLQLSMCRVFSRPSSGA
jgi:hypothetical protein